MVRGLLWYVSPILVLSRQWENHFLTTELFAAALKESLAFCPFPHSKQITFQQTNDVVVVDYLWWSKVSSFRWQTARASCIFVSNLGVSEIGGILCSYYGFRMHSVWGSERDSLVRIPRGSRRPGRSQYAQSGCFFRPQQMGYHRCPLRLTYPHLTNIIFSLFHIVDIFPLEHSSIKFSYHDVFGGTQQRIRQRIRHDGESHICHASHRMPTFSNQVNQGWFLWFFSFTCSFEQVVSWQTKPLPLYVCNTVLLWHHRSQREASVGVDSNCVAQKTRATDIDSSSLQ